AFQLHALLQVVEKSLFSEVFWQFADHADTYFLVAVFKGGQKMGYFFVRMRFEERLHNALLFKGGEDYFHTVFLYLLGLSLFANGRVSLLRGGKTARSLHPKTAVTVLADLPSACLVDGCQHFV